jgi:hypothetical protein
MLRLTAILALPVAAQQRLTSPKEFFGHEIGAEALHDLVERAGHGR